MGYNLIFIVEQLLRPGVINAGFYVNSLRPVVHVLINIYVLLIENYSSSIRTSQWLVIMKALHTGLILSPVQAVLRDLACLDFIDMKLVPDWVFDVCC